MEQATVRELARGGRKRKKKGAPSESEGYSRRLRQGSKRLARSLRGGRKIKRVADAVAAA